MSITPQTLLRFTVGAAITAVVLFLMWYFTDFIFKQFMEALTADNGKHRTLTYYADLFCYSPKYLSRIVKQISGKNALTLIHENAIEHIIPELRHSNKSIKEISVDFEFPNVSFFAQYVKKYLGMTPTEYRNSSQEKK